MSHVSRRDFFRRLSHSVGDQVTEVLVKPIQNLTGLDGVEAPPLKVSSRSFPIGRMIDFPPGAHLTLEYEGSPIQIHSDELGIWATGPHGCRYELRRTPSGTIEVNLAFLWSEQTVLSHATLEPVVNIKQENSL